MTKLTIIKCLKELQQQPELREKEREKQRDETKLTY
jgi:hypothetical protein